MYGLKSVQLLNIHTQETYFYMVYQDPFGSHQVQQRHFDGNPNKHDSNIGGNPNKHDSINKIFFMFSYRLCLFVQKPAKI